MAVCFWYLVKSDLSSVRYCTLVHTNMHICIAFVKTLIRRYPKNTAMFNWSPCTSNQSITCSWVVCLWKFRISSWPPRRLVPAGPATGTGNRRGTVSTQINHILTWLYSKPIIFCAVTIGERVGQGILMEGGWKKDKGVSVYFFLNCSSIRNQYGVI